MSRLQPFLLALELDLDADERAIRRAYAKRLKRIDPEADPAAFQALRETFEAALAWVALPDEQRRAQGVVASVAVPTPRDPRSVPVDPPAAPAAPSGFSWQMDDAKEAAPRAPDARPVAVPSPSPRPAVAKPAPAARPVVEIPQQSPADRVYTDFIGRFTRLASDEARVLQMLREALADPRLVNLEARTQFEGRIATLIVGGWRPGHEFLFKPACEVFEWEADRRRLEIFGETGKILDAAVRQRLIFFAQPAIAFEAQKTLLRRLRSERPVSARELGPEMPVLGQLLQRYPQWLRVMTRQDVVRHWIDTWNKLAAEARAAQSPAPARAPAPSRAGANASGNARATPGAAARAGRVDTRRPPASTPAPPHAAAPRNPGGSGRMNWLWVAAIIGGVRFFATLGDAPHPAAPPPTAFIPPVITAPASPPTQTAQSIRQLAGRPAEPNLQWQPSLGGINPADGTGATVLEEARRQRQLDATARRQLELDERYQDIVRARQAKRATRPGAQGDEPVLVIPAPN